MERILTDQGVNFESKVMKQLCELLGSNKLHTSTYHAPGNGITERLNRTIKPALAKFVNERHTDWDAYLQLTISAYNNSVHSSTGVSPYEAMFNRQPVMVADIIMNNKLPINTAVKDVADFTLAMRNRAHKLNSLIFDNNEIASAKQKHYYDRFVRNNTKFQVGDLVKINNTGKSVGLVKSFMPKFIGPFQITRILGDLNYQLESANLKTQIVHYNKLSKFNNRINDVLTPLEPSSEPNIVAEVTVQEDATLDLIQNQLVAFQAARIISKRRKQKRLDNERARLLEEVNERAVIQYRGNMANWQDTINMVVNENVYLALDSWFVHREDLLSEQAQERRIVPFRQCRNRPIHEVEPELVDDDSWIINEDVVRELENANVEFLNDNGDYIDYSDFERNLNDLNDQARHNNVNRELVNDPVLSLTTILNVSNSTSDVWHSGVAALNLSDSTSSNENSVVLNENGKPIIPCEFCGEKYVAHFGMKIHLKACKVLKDLTKQAKRSSKNPVGERL